MATGGFTLHGVTDDRNRWLVFGIALHQVLVTQIRSFVEQEVQKEYDKLQTSHNIHTQSTPGRIKNWPTFLKYENINGNNALPRLRGGRYNYSLFDCRVTSHVDFAKLYVENHMAKFIAFDEHCDASAMLTLLGKVPVFSLAVQSAAGDVKQARNAWTHHVLSDWDPVNYQQSFKKMERLVKALDLPTAFERNLLGELKDLESRGTLLSMGNASVDPYLLKLVQLQEDKISQVIEDRLGETEAIFASMGREVDTLPSDLEDVPSEIRARGPRATLAYVNALQSGEVKVRRTRIMLIGQAGAGKTSLKKSLLGLPFDPEEQSTEGIEVDPSSFGVDIDQVKNWQRTDPKLGVSQFAEELVCIAAKEFDKQEAKVLIDVDKTNHKDPTISLSLAEMKEALGHHTDGKNVNEINVPEVKIDPTLPPEEFTQCLIKYLEGKLDTNTRSKEPVFDLDLWDLAGQHLYYASHAVFLSRQTIYLLVCNLSIRLNDTAEPCARQGIHKVYFQNPNGQTNLDDLLSWLVSVSAVCPSKLGKNEKGPVVFIVGTHADKPVQDIKDIKKQIRKGISGKDYDRHVMPVIISIDNTRSSSDTGVDELRKEIIKVLKEDPNMEKKIPVRWFNFEKVVEALVAEKVHYLDLTRLQPIVQKVCFIKDENECEVMLDFYHDLGLIVKHGNTVVLQAQWLIDIFKQLMTIPCYENMEPKYRKDWAYLEREGVLGSELVHHLFSKFTLQASVTERDKTERDILDMMDRFGLIAKFETSPNEVSYFVPTQLRRSPEDLCEEELQASSNLCPLYVDFGSPLDVDSRSGLAGFVPHGFFSQLVSRCIRWCSEKCFKRRPKLFHCASEFFIETGTRVTHKLFLVCKKRFIKVILNPVQESPSAEAEEVPSLVRRFLEDTLNDLILKLPWYSNLEYEVRVACTLCPERTCPEHKEISCTHEDCLCLVKMVPLGEQLFCREGGGELTVPKLDGWFPQSITLQSAKDNKTQPPVEGVPPVQDHSRKRKFQGDSSVGQETEECAKKLKTCSSVKHGKPTLDELEGLGNEIGDKWMKLGRRLKVRDPYLQGIDRSYHQLCEKAFHMLKHWKEKNGGAATYQTLCDALRHKNVQRQDLAEEFCYSDDHSRKRKFQGDSSVGQETEECAKKLKTCSSENTS